MNILFAPGIVITELLLVAGLWLGWQLLRQNGRMLLRIEELEKRLDALEFGEPGQPVGLPLGSPAPYFELPDLAGERKALVQFQSHSLVLVFFNPACGFCRDLGEKLGKRKQKSGSQEPFLLAISTGEADQNCKFFGEHKLTFPVLLQKEMEVANAYQANGTPSGYLIDAEGKIASGLAIGADALLALLDGKVESRKLDEEMAQSLLTPSPTGGGRENRFGNRSLARSKIKRDGLKAGTPAPDFRLPRLNGSGDLGLQEFHGRRLLLVFSSPHCGPCNELAPELEQFHRDHRELEVMMIGRGEPKENRAKVKEHGLTFPVVLQQQWEVSRLYGMFATPMAYLIDQHGVIVRDVAVGLEPIRTVMRDIAAENAPVLAHNRRE